MSGGLRAEALEKSFPTPAGALQVLRGASMTLAPGESVAIMGPSGSGKSTLLNILGTLEPPTAGRVLLDGQNPFDLREAELARFRNRRIGFVFQDHHLLPQCTALENALTPTLATTEGGDALDRAHRLLELVGLADRAEHFPAELSGGERQRVAIARALVQRPALVLADEPTGNLDHRAADLVAGLLLEMQQQEGVMLVTVTHSASLAQRFDRRLEMTDGTLRDTAEG